MSYYDVITNVERKIEREQAYMELHRDGLFCSENLSTYEAIGYVKNVVLDTKKSGNSMTVISFEYEKNLAPNAWAIPIITRTVKEKKYIFQELFTVIVVKRKTKEFQYYMYLHVIQLRIGRILLKHVKL